MESQSIVIELADHPHANTVLDRLATAAESLGHDVTRWRLGTEHEGIHPLPPCHRAILWSGFDPRYDGVVAAAKREGIKLLYAEDGLKPGVFHLDEGGVGPFASWSVDPGFDTLTGPAEYLYTTPAPILVWLQWHKDINISRFSPWFYGPQSHLDLLRFLLKNTNAKLLVRPHPKMAKDQALRELVESSGRCEMVPANTFHEMAGMCEFGSVATINDVAGYDAIKYRLPVLCYGQACYRHRGLVYDLDDNPKTTKEAWAELSRLGFTSLRLERIEHFVEVAEANQWRPSDLPWRLQGALA